MSGKGYDLCLPKLLFHIQSGIIIDLNIRIYCTARPPKHQRTKNIKMKSEVLKSRKSMSHSANGPGKKKFGLYFPY